MNHIIEYLLVGRTYLFIVCAVLEALHKLKIPIKVVIPSSVHLLL
jgi:hypothetical protein